MKRIAGAIISVGLVLALAGCTWRVPETVSIKTDAEYNFSLGTFEKELDSELDMSSMIGNAGSGSEELQFFDYFPEKADSKTQHFMIQVKLSEVDLAALISGWDAAVAAVPGDEIDLSDPAFSAVTSYSVPLETKGIGFNPSTLLNGMKDSIGSDMDGKIEFDSVPLYLYCQTTKGLKAKATLEMFYGTNAEPPVAHTTPVEILKDTEIQNKPLPDFAKDGETVITSLPKTSYVATKDIKDLINSSDPAIQDGDQLCVGYAISNLNGTLKKSDLENDGFKIIIYAVIDVPVRFKVTNEINLDLSSMSGSSSGSGSGSGSSSVEVPEYVEKVLNTVTGISVKFTANKLPIHKSSGTMQLGVNLLNTGDPEDMKWANISDSGKQEVITLSRKTLNAFKESPSFNPNIKIKMTQGTVFSVPREKAVNMYVELSVKTGGSIQVM